ncbi:P-loop containing nucleoside triphosphate hydrolase protein [Pseudomassariella vexata]|uniref:p-loop containing nucleoside triphosphate hydrolase protein n=1 Tax=Pseudomassariella vexata TaxID=1141098 RepID=A0A1Y2EAH7_9PEZI|nr:P-loop containing nucleoside triphosphate hydrolase protein [Pseudomassariella vexata]ORY68397.1 P-loop containing nucleoside triphosphate hydrolase protein [Pseudomassariella vexata]
MEKIDIVSLSSASDSGSSGPESGSENGQESDSLDSDAPRKRRKAILDVEVDPVDDEPYQAPIVSSITGATSRIKKKVANTNPPKAEPDVVFHPTTTAVPVDPNTTFESLHLRPWLVNSLANMAIKRPTGIQKHCIPEILKGRDCIGGSRTGSGKTVAFAAPILQKLAEDPSSIFAVVLTATRELALQIFEQFKAISAAQTLRAVLITGGSDMRPQAIALAERPHLIIATPGRLADHIRNSGEDTICGLRRVKFLVLDEADRLLASGGPGSMLPDIAECLSVLPKDRQTLLFTATMTPEVRQLQDRPRESGKPPVFVCEVDTRVLAIPNTLNQCYVQVPVTHREHYLHTFLLTEANIEKSVIIFCNRTSTADFLHHLLRLLDHRVTSLHSKLSQKNRIDNLGRFRAAAARILVATDVAARGLDIPEVSLVINYDVPRNPDDYIHRVGRTARAGRKGDAVTFVGQRDVELVHAIEKRVGREMIAWGEEGVNLETRVIRDALKLVGEMKREALLEIEEHREVGGKRKRGMQKLRVQ